MPGVDNLIILDKDLVFFDPSSYLPAVPIPPVVVGKMKASGKTLVCNQKVCLKGDEANVKVKSGYMTASHPIPGNGTFIIKALNKGQFSEKTVENDTALITTGKTFVGEFQVQTPAKVPTPAGPQDSPVPVHPGKGFFLNIANFNVFAG